MTTTIQNVYLPLSNTPNQAFDVRFADTIEAVAPAGTDRRAGEVIDGEGRFLLPGLIDTHVHLGSRDTLQAAARAGVTTMVDLGTHPDQLIDQLRAEAGVANFLSAGTAASAPGSTQIALMGFPAEGAVTGPGDAERYLAWRTAGGADLIKIIVEDPAATEVPALGVETIRALVEGAHARGLVTVAHVVTAAAFERGLDAGVDILTHAPLDRPLPDDTVQRLLESGTVVSPTLVMMRVMAHARLGDRAEAAIENATESVRKLLQAGVAVIAGTDANETPFAPVAHGSSLHDELSFLQAAGMTATEALRAATSHAASAVRLGDRGALDVGQRADLMLLDADPTADLAAARIPNQIWIGGSAVARAD
ncbi:amidohydrolase family protein [Nocardia sp. NBC_00416]|uniref:amidohydrolase family protein n=1 Tax=Nocardia sp. NBC_00416 TaxID=2975991 RepID=UPI002E1F386A